MDAPDDEPPAIPAACLHVVLAQLPAAALASLSAVSRDFRDALQDDAVWRHRCALDYGVTTMAGPDMQPAPSFRATCAAWHPLFKRYGPLAARAAAAWRRVEGWTAAHVPAVAASLRPGATEAELDEAEAQLGFALPEALRALYAVHDGQRLEFDDGMDADRPAVGPSLFHGLFGGYCVYTHVVSTRMLPLRRMVMWTRRVADRLVQQAEEEEEEEDDEDADDGDPGGPPTR
jgi:F-box protein 3